MNKTLLIAKDVYKRNVQSLSFFSMVFMPIIMAVTITIFSYFIMRPQETPIIGVISNNQNIISYLEDNSKVFKIDDSIHTKKQAEDKILASKIVGYLEQENNNNFNFISSKIDTNLENNIKVSLNNFKIITLTENNDNVSEHFINELNNPINFNTSLVNIKNNKIQSESKQNNIAQFISVAMCTLIFLFIMNYSAIIGHEISAEKGSRIMEVILSSTTANSHLTGKLLGILMMCLTQISIYLSLGGITLFLLKNNPIIQTVFVSIELSTNTKYVIFINMLYFVFSVVVFSLLTSILASLVSRTEDISKVLQPITLIGMGGFYLGIILAQNNPNHIAIKITSYIPFLSNFIMPFRLANQSVNNLNIIVSILIYLVFLILLFIFTYKIYKNNVLMYKDFNNIFSAFINSLKNMKRYNKSNTNNQEGLDIF